jgi:hypothetical protein
MVWGNDQMPTYLCVWHVLNVWRLCSIEKINGVQHAILDDLYTIMYMPIKPSENIEAL